MDRSKSYAGGMQIEPYYGGGGGAGRMQIEPYYGGGGGGARPDFRSYSYSAGAGGGMSSSSYAYQYEYGGGQVGSAPAQGGLEEVQRSKSSTKRRWLALVGDPDLERKRRVASYKAYAVEGRVKGSFRRSFRWVKQRYLHLVYGWS